MSISLATRPAVNPTYKSAGQDPWLEPPVYAVEKGGLVFGARIHHRVIPGLWKVVRGPERSESTRPYIIRVREVAENGSLFGPVLSWTLKEVASLVTDEPVAVDVCSAHVETLAPAADKPLVVAMAIGINGTHYSVSPLAPSPDAVKAFRFVVIGGDGRAYDVEELEGGARCDCGDFVFRREGLDTLGCKHVRAAWMCGLIAEYSAAPQLEANWPQAIKGQSRAAAEVRLIDDDGTSLETPGEMDARHRSEHMARVRALLDGNPFLDPAAREVEQVPCCDPAEALPCQACVNVHTLPDDLSGDDWQDGFRYELGPDDAPDPDGWMPTAAEFRQAEEDGAYEQCEGEGPMADATDECHVAVAAGLADWMRESGLVPYIDWVSRENRDDLMADDAILCGWACHRERDRHEGVKARQLAYATAPDPTLELDLADQVADVADAYRSNGTAFGSFLAKHLDELADRVRFLGATTTDAYQDRHQALRDSVRTEAEARDAAG